MPLRLNHLRNGGARITHTTGRTIDLLVVDWNSSHTWVDIQVYGGDCDRDIRMM